MGFVTNLAGTLKYNTYVDGSPSGVDNDQGNIRAGGTIAETDLWTSSALGEEDRFVILSSGAGGTTGVVAPSTTTTFNQYAQLGDIVKVTTSLAGVSNDALLFGASDSAEGPSINQLAVMRISAYKQAIVNNKWNEYSGTWDTGYPVNATSGALNIIAGVDQSSNLVGNKTDKAANPSAAEPGHLAYTFGAPLPTTGLYAPRSTW